MQVHLVIQYGCDNRRKLVSDHITVSRRHVDSIIIINSGPAEFMDFFRKMALAPKIVQIPYFYGSMEPSRRAILKNVPKNDWFLHLDSDEAPSAILINTLRTKVQELDSAGFNCARTTWMEEACDDYKGTITYRGPRSYDNQPATKEESTDQMCPKRLIKNIDGWEINTNYGMHEEFFHKKEIEGFLSKCPIIHKKSHIQRSQSCVTATYSMPSVHIGRSEQHDFLNSPEFKKLTEFKKSTGVKTSNDLMLKFMDKSDTSFKEKYIEFANSPEFAESKWFPFQHYKDIIFFDLDVRTPSRYCGLECCRYEVDQL